MILLTRLYICEDMTKARWGKNIGNEKLSAVFAKKCICDFLDLEESESSVFFEYNNYGKPLIKNIYNADGSNIDISLHFSLSHSENMIICAVSCFNIGADCQKKNIYNINNCRKIAKRFYTEEENKFLDTHKNALEYINNFFEIWVKKEAYIKYTGKGLAEGLKSFSVADNISGQRNYYKDVTFRKIKITGCEDFFVFLCCGENNKDIPEIIMQ